MSLWNGTVVLENLEVKKTLFDSMPVAFNIHYGRIGRIFIQVPYTNLSGAPLKIEISDIFVFIKPKYYNEWKDQVEIDAFIAKNLAELMKFEQIIQEKVKLDQQNPGMMASLMQNVIDNIQIKISNIYIRMEDDVSYPNHPFALGMVIGGIEAETMNANWEPEFIANQIITYKQLLIKDFGIYLNFDESKPQSVLLDNIIKEKIISEQSQVDEGELIIDYQSEYKKFQKEECSYAREEQNQYLIKRTSFHNLFELNKEIMENRKPQIKLKILIGGQFRGKDHDVVDGGLFFILQKQQITLLSKFTEFTGNYGKFQTGVQSQFHKRNLNEIEEKEYIEWYKCYKECQDKKDNENIAFFKQKLEEVYETKVYFEKLLPLRTIGQKEFEFEKMQEDLKNEVDTKVKDLEYQKSTGYFGSMKGWLGYGKSQEDIDREKLQIQEFKEALNREAQEKINKESEILKDQIQLIKQKTGVGDNIDVDTYSELKGTDYILYDFWISIPEINLLLKKEDGQSVIEISLQKTMCDAKKGLDFLDAKFSLQIFNIQDHISQSSAYPYLLQTYIPLSLKTVKSLFNKSKKNFGLSNENILNEENALNIRFQTNPAFENCPFKFNMMSQAQLILFVNFYCLSQIQMLFSQASITDQTVLDYYKDKLNEEVFKYVYEGTEFMNQAVTQEQESQVNEQNPPPKYHPALHTDVNMIAPLILIPNDYYGTNDKNVLGINLGHIKVSSSLVKFDPNKDYINEENDPQNLYDKYTLYLDDFQIVAFEQLKDYLKYRVEKQATQIISDFQLTMILCYNVEPQHKLYPPYEVQLTLEKMQMLLSDYIAIFLLKTQKALYQNQQKYLTARATQQTQEPAVVNKDEESFKQNESLKQSLSIQEEFKSNQQEKNNQQDEEEEFYDCESSLKASSPEVKKEALRIMSTDNKVSYIREINEQEMRQVEIRKSATTPLNMIMTIKELLIEVKQFNQNFNFEDLIEEQNQSLLKSSRSGTTARSKNQDSHLDLLKIEMKDMTINYALMQDAKTKITMIIAFFNISDISNSQNNNQKIYNIPQCYRNIVQNPNPDINNINMDDLSEEYYDEEDEDESANRRREKNEKFQDLKSNPRQSIYLQEKYCRSESYSIISNDFKTCKSECPFHPDKKIDLPVNFKEVDCASQVYIRVIQNPILNMQKVDFVFSDMRITMSFPTFKSLASIQHKINDYKELEKKLDMIKKGSILGAFEMAKQQQSSQNQKDSQESPNNEENMLGGQLVQGLGLEMRSYSMMAQSYELKKAGQRKYALLSKQNKMKFTINGYIKDFSIWIPLDAKDSKSRVFQMSFMTKIDYKCKQIDNEFINSITKDIFYKKLQSSKEDAILTINQFQLIMVNRHLLKDENDPNVTVEKLLEPSRITVKFENEIEKGGLKSERQIEVVVEPFEIKIGLREIDFFNKLNKNIADFTQFYYQQQEEDLQSSILSTTSMGYDLDRILEKQQKIKEEQIQKIAEEQSQAAQSSKNIIRVKKEEQIGIQNIKFQCNIFRFSLMDDTGQQEYPIIFLNVNHINLNYRLYEDIDNAAIFFLKKIGVIKKKSDEEEPYLNVQASLLFEFYYFNMNLQAYEPLFEPWRLCLTQLQEEKYMPLETTISSTQFLNMNITYAFMQQMTYLQQRLSQTSEDWELEMIKENAIQEEEEDHQFQIKEELKEQEKKATLIEKDTNIQTPIKEVRLSKPNSQIDTARKTVQSQQQDELQNGFIFINRLKLPLTFCIEGTSVAEMKEQLFMGLGGKGTSLGQFDDFDENVTLDELLAKVDNNDSKSHFKKLALIKRFNQKKKQHMNQIEKITRLEKKGEGASKFRKSQELYYLMKNIKIKEGKGQDQATLEEEMLRLDISIEGLKKIRGIPIELGGVRSYVLDHVVDLRLLSTSQSNDKANLKTQNTIQRQITKVGEAKFQKSKISMIVKVQFENQARKEIEFQSTLLFSNASEHQIIICSTDDIDDISSRLTDSQKWQIIEPNQLFYVPLSWFIKGKHIFVRELNGKFVELFSNIREYFAPDQLNYDHIKPKVISVSMKDNKVNYVAINISYFKCKPTTLNVPGQFLVTFTPPICVCNYLFNELSLYNSENQQIGSAQPGEYFYLSDFALYDQLDEQNNKNSKQQQLVGAIYSSEENVQWNFKNDYNSSYSSNLISLFSSTNSNIIDQIPYNQIEFKLQNTSIIGGTIVGQINQSTFRNESAISEVKEDHSKNNAIINIQQLPFNLINNEYDNFELRDKIFEKTSAFNLALFPQSMIVNQTNFTLNIKAKIDKVNDKIITIEGGKNEFFYSFGNKAQIKIDNYQWSKQFDVTTVGLNGSLDLLREEQQSKQVSDQNEELEKLSKILNFGIIIQNGQYPFNKTRIIKVVPRFILYNNLPYPIIIKQKNNDQLIFLRPKEKQVYNFQNKSKDAYLMVRNYWEGWENEDNLIQEEKIREKLINIDLENQREEEANLQREKRIWSSAFSIEDIEDFQISFFKKNYQEQQEQQQNPTTTTSSSLFRLQLQKGPSSMNEKRPKLIWWNANPNNEFHQFLRVSVCTQDEATLFVAFNNPRLPEYLIINNSGTDLEYSQFNCEKDTQKRLANKDSSVYSWFDLLQAVKKLTFHIDGESQSFGLDKMTQKTKEFKTKKDTYYLQITFQGDIRTVEVRSKSVDELERQNREKGSSYLGKLLLRKFLKSGYKQTLSLKGFGLSLIDNEPKEIIYMSIYKINIVVESWTERLKQKEGSSNSNDELQSETITSYDIEIDHIQIDNVINEVMPAMFAPSKQLVKNNLTMRQLKEQIKDYTPFVQIKITQSEIKDNGLYIKKYKGLQVSIQEMKFEIESSLISALLKFMFELTSLQKTKTEFLTGMTLQTLKNKRLSEKRSSSGMESILLKSREDVCQQLLADLPALPDMALINEKKIYFEFVDLGALKVILALKFEKRAFSLKVDPSQAFGFLSILYTLGSSVATVSESPIAFKEIILMHTFASQNNLMYQLIRNYTRQGILQFYRIIGSSDILGNPVGLIDKLGTGVFEFFNEPRKGLLKGPREFSEGISKGVKSLVTNIVAGSFDSISKISGSLYGVVKNVSGQEVEQNIKKPEHAFEGVYLGLKGGTMELVGGITGIFTKPYQGAKQGGAKGFVKGVGSGLVGAVASPFAATLRLGNNLSTGIKNTAIRIGKGKIPIYGRFRHPRYFNSKGLVQPYDAAFAEANQILRTINKGQFANSTIYFFADLTMARRDWKSKELQTQGILIITNQYVLYVEDFKSLKFSSMRASIKNCEVYQERVDSSIRGIKKAKKKDSEENEKESLQIDEMYSLHITTKKKEFLRLESNCYALMDKAYSLINM